jgi:hypothetical protein
MVETPPAIVEAAKAAIASKGVVKGSVDKPAGGATK